MPPAKVFIFIGCLLFIFLIGFFLWEPENITDIPCEGGLHSHDGGPVHCD